MVKKKNSRDTVPLSVEPIHVEILLMLNNPMSRLKPFMDPCHPIIEEPTPAVHRNDNHAHFKKRFCISDLHY